MATDGSGALAALGINPVPQGTPEELRKQGTDPAHIASCAPTSPGVRGCAVWNDCPFHLQKFGGFKGNHGPENIPYYLRTHEGQQKQDYMPCHAFVRTMLSRMRAGIAQAAEGKPHEIVRILGREGMTVRTKLGVPVDPNNHNINARYEAKVFDVVVPKHPRPGERVNDSYEAEMWREEMERQKLDPDFAVGPGPVIADETEPFTADDDLDMDALAAPVEKKK